MVRLVQRPERDGSAFIFRSDEEDSPLVSPAYITNVMLGSITEFLSDSPSALEAFHQLLDLRRVGLFHHPPGKPGAGIDLH